MVKRSDILKYRSAIEAGSNAVECTDSEALAVQGIYPAWDPTEVYAAGIRVQYHGTLHKCLQDHTAQADWTPDATPAMWAVIDKTHAGTLDDPIPASRGMEYEYGKYYLDGDDGNTYLCQRTGEAAGGTIVLQYMPH